MAFVDTVRTVTHTAKCDECDPKWESVETEKRHLAKKWATSHDESVHGLFVKGK
jgi:hypothetical protein